VQKNKAKKSKNRATKDKATSPKMKHNTRRTPGENQIRLNQNYKPKTLKLQKLKIFRFKTAKKDKAITSAQYNGCKKPCKY